MPIKSGGALMANGASTIKKSAGFWTNLSLRAKALVVISLPVVAFFASTFLIVAVERVKDDQQSLLKSGFDLRAQLLNMYIVMSSAESAMRNFALTGREDGIQPLRLVGPSLDSYFEKMSTLHVDNAEQANRLSQLKQRAHDRLDGIKNLHDFYQAH